MKTVDLRTKKLNRIKSAIKSNSGIPILWTNARQSMVGPGNRGDARFDNMLIQEFVAAGQLKMTWTDFGDTLLGL